MGDGVGVINDDDGKEVEVGDVAGNVEEEVDDKTSPKWDKMEMGELGKIEEVAGVAHIQISPPSTEGPNPSHISATGRL